MGLDPAHPFPKILGKSLNFVVTVEGSDAFGRSSGIAVVQVPRALPRVIQLPEEVSGNRSDHTLLSSIIHAHIDELFPGMECTGCYQFRVTRDGDLWVDEEEVDDLLTALEGELPERKYSRAVRLELAKECSEDTARFLLEMFDLEERDLYRVDGPVNLSRLGSLYDLVERGELKYPPFSPRVPRQVERGESLFDFLGRQDLLLHHPFDSFLPVLEFVRQAAADPNVLAIKHTVYRVGSSSPIVDALIEAARAGKEVTVVVELFARFDEERNIDLATRLQEVGAKVCYGIVGYKTHAKMLLVVRREGDRLRRYVHVGTGNYHAGTARAYTDIGLMTSDEAMGRDVHDLFLQLTGLGRAVDLVHLLQSPFTLRTTIIERIEAEAEAARDGRPARIVARMNALTEPSVIQALYAASQAGVQIDLIIRGACCLRPGGRRGVRDDPRAVGHRALPRAQPGVLLLRRGEELTYCASADWMSRNLRRRVEACFPILDKATKRRSCARPSSCTSRTTRSPGSSVGTGRTSAANRGRPPSRPNSRCCARRQGGRPRVRRRPARETTARRRGRPGSADGPRARPPRRAGSRRGRRAEGRARAAPGPPDPGGTRPRGGVAPPGATPRSPHSACSSRSGRGLRR